jgi:hypothetical protein
MSYIRTSSKVSGQRFCRTYAWGDVDGGIAINSRVYGDSNKVISIRVSYPEALYLAIKILKDLGKDYENQKATAKRLNRGFHKKHDAHEEKECRKAVLEFNKKEKHWKSLTEEQREKKRFKINKKWKKTIEGIEKPPETRHKAD